MVGVAHIVGLVFLLLATGMLIAVTVSAPVVGDIGILKVYLTNASDIRHSSVTFGTFGHCVLDVAPPQTDQDYCFPKHVGYKPAHIMAQIDGGGFDYTGAGTADVLTNVMILHPLAAAIAFIAVVVSLIPGGCAAIFASAITALAWVITLVVMAIDFAWASIIKNHVNGDGSGSHAVFQAGMWLCLGAMLLLFFAVFLIFFSCFSRRKQRKLKHSGGTYNGKTDYSQPYNTAY